VKFEPFRLIDFPSVLVQSNDTTLDEGESADQLAAAFDEKINTRDPPTSFVQLMFVLQEKAASINKAALPDLSSAFEIFYSAFDVYTTVFVAGAVPDDPQLAQLNTDADNLVQQTLIEIQSNL
jgi:hypothetical protein